MSNKADIVAAKSDLQPSPRATAAGELVTGPDFLSAFEAEFNPLTPTEQVLVEELARRAGQMRDFDSALNLLRLEGEVALTNVISSRANSADAASSVARASVLCSDRHEALLRQGISAARGYYRALRELRGISVNNVKCGSNFMLIPDRRFRSEQACRAYLIRRYLVGTCGCRRCGSLRLGCFVPARIVWECGRCQAQTGLRHGTCMARSPLPLQTWFAAIRVVLWYPAIATAELQAILHIDRTQTVRSVVGKIKRAIESDSASALLAGLDEAYLFST